MKGVRVRRRTVFAARGVVQVCVTVRAGAKARNQRGGMVRVVCTMYLCRFEPNLPIPPWRCVQRCGGDAARQKAMVTGMR